MGGRQKSVSGSSESSKVSALEMNRILDRLEANKNRSETKENYHKVWTLFNKFLIRLDNKPKFWEDWVALL